MPYYIRVIIIVIRKKLVKIRVTRFSHMVKILNMATIFRRIFAQLIIHHMEKSCDSNF